MAEDNKRQPDVLSALEDVPEIHIEALFDEPDRWYSYKRISLFAAVQAVSLPGDYVQLGVYKGRCARFLANLMPRSRKLYLLDSFEGLPEDWIGSWKKGAFALSQEQRPAFRQPNVEVVPGWFSETVPVLAGRLTQPVALIHADADLYSSTLEALEGLNEHIVPGTVIVFDEYMIRAGDEMADDEHRALVDWCRNRNRGFDYLWKTRWAQVGIRITK